MIQFCQKNENLHFCQAERSVAKSIPVVDVAPTLDQNLFSCDGRKVIGAPYL